MATFKAIVLRHHKKEDNTYNVKIRVTHNRKSRYLPTTIFLSPEDLTKSLRIKNQKIIDDLEDVIRHYRSICNENPNIEDLTVEQVIEFIRLSKEAKKFSLDFIKFSMDNIEELKLNNRHGTAMIYLTAIRALKRFIGRDYLDISEITKKFLNDFVDWIVRQEHSTRIRSLYPQKIQTLFNIAKDKYNDEDLGVINIPHSPFKNFKMPDLPPVKKRALPVDLIQNIIDLPYIKEHKTGIRKFNIAKDLFVLSFGLIGMNTVDLFNCTEIRNGYITYNRTKTKTRRKDKAEMRIKIQPEIMPLFEKYKDKSGNRVFCFYDLYPKHTDLTHIVNLGLKQIGELIGVEGLQFYAARHSWATIALNVAKIDKYTVHTALNHVDSQMKVTDIYIDKDYSIIDDANEKVLRLFSFPAKS